jgi:signal transduction histidine kinase
VLDDAGLVPAIESLATGAWRRAAIRVRVEGSTGGRLPPLVETVLYRVVQEALTNVVKHARATSVTVRVLRDARAVTCEVHDDGIGFEPGPTSGLGLLGIRERAAALGGSVEIRAVPGEGTALSVTIPIEPDASV